MILVIILSVSLCGWGLYRWFLRRRARKPMNFEEQVHRLILQGSLAHHNVGECSKYFALPLVLP